MDVVQAGRGSLRGARHLAGRPERRLATARPLRDAAPARQEVDVDHACEDTSFANVDAHTTLFGYFGEPGRVAVIARTHATSPWALTQAAPEDAPGLARVDRRLTTRFIASAGRPLVALGSGTGGTSGPRSSTRRPRRGVRRSRCTSRAAGAGRYVPGPTGIHVISPEIGVVTLPGGTTGRCDVVVPDGPQDAVQLVAAGGPRRWPTVLRRVSFDGTDRLGRFPTRTRSRCAGVEQSYDRPTSFEMSSTRIDQGQTVRIARRGDGWIVRTSRW